jgi:hypothetical protein
MNNSPRKIKLTGYEMLMMMGAGGDPHLSERLKAALDREMKKDQYKDLAEQSAWARAGRNLAVNDTTAFDSANRDDMAFQKLFPLMYTEDGKQVEAEEVLAQFDLSNVTLTHEVKGKDVVFDVIAEEKDGSCKSAKFGAKLKEDASEDLPTIGIHKCK